VLNLFLVLLLSSFSADALDKKGDDEEVDKISEAKGRIVRFFQYVNKSVRNRCCAWRQSKTLKVTESEELVDIRGIFTFVSLTITASRIVSNNYSRFQTSLLVILLVSYQ